MEELTRLQAWHKVFRGHVMRLHSKVNDPMDSDLDDYMITSLNIAIEQIKRKGYRVAQVHKKNRYLNRRHVGTRISSL